jgi:predicted TIM-barrel fold metal-dependent hydrolase
MIVDAHVHAFLRVHGETASGPVRGAGYGRVTMGGERIQLIPPGCEGTAFTVETLIAHMDWAGVDRAVVLQGCFYGEENAYVSEACKAHPERISGVAFLDPWDANARAEFDTWASKRVFCGLKLECTESTGLLGLHPGARLDETALSWLWHDLDALGWTLVVDLGRPGSASYQTDAVRGIATSHPTLRVVVAHLGQPGPWLDGDPQGAKLWRNQVLLARLSNVWLDASALPAYRADEGYPWPGAAGDLQHAIDLVGPEKILWGTDVPGLLTQGTYPQLRWWAEDALASLTAHERALVLGESAREVFSLP